MRNQAPPTLSPDVGGALAVSYEHSVSTDLGLRAELAGGVFYGGGQAKQSQTSYAVLGDAGVVFRFDVLKYVPYAFAGVGGVASGGIDSRGARAVAPPGIGNGCGTAPDEAHAPVHAAVSASVTIASRVEPRVAIC